MRILTTAYWKRYLSPHFAVYKLLRLIRSVHWFFIKRKLQKKYGFKTQESYSRCAEDLIVLHTWKQVLGRSGKMIYLDIGAYHPVRESNTYLLYTKGMRGLNIEPDPTLFGEFPKQRPEDVNVNCGISFEEDSEADFYVMSGRVYNTFSKQTADALIRRKATELVEVLRIPLRTVDSVLSEFAKGDVDFVTIDTEGLDIEIVKSWNFDRCRPALFCIESKGLDAVMIRAGYKAVERTDLNTIYADSNLL